MTKTSRRLLFSIIGVIVALMLITVVVANLGDAPTATPATPNPTPTATEGQEARSDQPTDGNAATPGDDSTGLPLPPAEQRAPLVRKPLPKSGAAEGELVAGFPTDLLPLATDAAVGNSSIATEGNRLQAGVQATSPRPAAEVLAFYQQAYAALGLTVRDVDAIPGSTAQAFGRGNDTITLTVTPTDSGSAFSLFGAFTAG